MSKFLVVGVMVACLATLTGCETLQPRAFPAEMGQAFTQIGTSFADQGVWESMLARLGAQVVEPGILGYAGMLYVAGGKLTGVSGQLNLEGDGVGSGGLSPEAREAILKLSQRPDLFDKVKALLKERADYDAIIPAPSEGEEEVPEIVEP